MEAACQGSIIIGCNAHYIKYDKDEYTDLNDFLNHNNITGEYSYETGDWFVGYLIDNVLVEQIDDKWVKMIKEKASEFKELTGCKARLIGID